MAINTSSQTSFLQTNSFPRITAAIYHVFFPVIEVNAVRNNLFLCHIQILTPLSSTLKNLWKAAYMLHYMMHSVLDTRLRLQTMPWPGLSTLPASVPQTLATPRNCGRSKACTSIYRKTRKRQGSRACHPPPPSPGFV